MKNCAMTTGNVISDEAKMTGMTPAVLTLSGIYVALLPLRPYLLAPTLPEYCTGILLSASCRTMTYTTIASMHAAMMAITTTLTATDLPVRNLSPSVRRSCGSEEMMLNSSTIEMPLPMPLSVIFSPIHIRNAEPADIVHTATITLLALKTVSSP